MGSPRVSTLVARGRRRGGGELLRVRGRGGGGRGCASGREAGRGREGGWRETRGNRTRRRRVRGCVGRGGRRLRGPDRHVQRARGSSGVSSSPGRTRTAAGTAARRRARARRSRGCDVEGHARKPRRRRRDDASLARRGGDVAVDVDGVGSTALLSPQARTTRFGQDAPRRRAATPGDSPRWRLRPPRLARRLTAATEALRRRRRGDGPEDEPLATDALARRRAAVTSMTPDAPTDDSFADAGALDESTVVDDDDKASLSGQKINVVKSGVSLETPTRPRLDLARPPPLAPPLTPPSPLAPGSSRARSCPTRSDGRKDLTSPATAFLRRKSAAGFDEKAPDSSPSARAGRRDDSAPRSARSSRAEALLRDARRGSSDDASESSLQERPRSRALAEEGSGGFQNESRRFSRNHFGSASASSVASCRRAEARARRSPRRTPPRGALAAARAARSTCEAPRRFRGGRLDEPGGGAAPRGAARRTRTRSRRRFFGGSTVSREKRLFGERRRVFVRVASDSRVGDVRAGKHDRRRAPRLEPVHGARRRSGGAARARFSGSETPGRGRGRARRIRRVRLRGSNRFLPRGGVGPDPEAMLWQLQQQQQMVFQQMQQLQLALQLQLRRAHAGSLHDTGLNSLDSSASANGFGADDGSRPPPNAFDLVRRNAVEEVTRLVETRLVSVHQLDADGNSLLMWACARGHRRLTKFLLKRGAAVNGRNAVGDTPLHFCLAGGHGELGAYLVAKGADAAANDRARRRTRGW